MRSKLVLIFLFINGILSHIIYYPSCSNSLISFVDGLRSIGVDSSFTNRKEIAKLNGYSSYSGTASENNNLFTLLKTGKLIKSITLDNYYPKCSSSYTSLVDALNSIGVDSSYTKRKEIAKLNGITDYTGKVDENNSLLNLLKSGLLKSNVSENSSSPENSTSNDNKMIDKLIENSIVNKNKKDTIKIIGNLLLKNGYETAFVAGVLGNVHSEASIGHFESSNYKSNPSAKPQYLKYMDDLYNYASLYSGKSITSVSLKSLNDIIEKLHNQNWEKGKFGLGCVQWTGERTRTIFKLYLKEVNGSDNINFEQAATAEGKMIINELSNKFSDIYKNWKNQYSNNLNSEDAAYNAGEQICLNYEKPAEKNKKKFDRANLAKDFYNIMVNA